MHLPTSVAQTPEHTTVPARACSDLRRDFDRAGSMLARLRGYWQNHPAGTSGWTVEERNRLAEIIRLLDSLPGATKPDCREPDGEELSPREMEILCWIARGKSNTVIAEILGISRHTVDTHNRRIFRKLEACDRTTAVLRALGAGLLDCASVEMPVSARRDFSER